MENQQYRDKIYHLQECVHAQGPPIVTQPNQAPNSQHPLAKWIEQRALPSVIVHERDPAFTARFRVSLPPAVVVQPVDIHPRFLPLRDNFQEGGTGGPMFTRPLDWPDAIQANPSVRPRRIRLWGSQLINLDDLYAYMQLGQILYGGNRPPGRCDPVEPQRQWRVIEATFFQGTVTIILQPHRFAEL